jgi:aspartate/methionine/tyrosine aminotransferase
VIYPDPGYPIYHSLANFIGAVPVPVQLREERGFRMDLDELAALVTPRTRLLVLNSPQNPTGGILTREDVEFIARLAVDHDLLVISDEIYSQIVYGPEHVSVLPQPGMKERTVLMDGLSKAYAMCGWRLGYGVAPRELAARMEALMINSSSCAAAFSQMAAIEALESPESDAAVQRMVEQFRARRDLMVEGLNAMPGVRCQVPQGAFYVFPNVEGTGLAERQLAEELLEEAGVALLPGTAFGQAGAGFLRLAYTQGEADLRTGLERMGNHLADRMARAQT